MSKDDQTLSPTEWKAVTDCVVELSQRMVQASSSPPRPPSHNGNGNGNGNGEKEK
jgi:hypothetical protein